MTILICTHRPVTVQAARFDGTMKSFDAIDAWMEGIDPDANVGYSGTESGAPGTSPLFFGVKCGPGKKRVEVHAGMWVLHRFVGGKPMFWVLTADEFSELYD